MADRENLQLTWVPNHGAVWCSAHTNVSGGEGNQKNPQRIYVTLNQRNFVPRSQTFGTPNQVLRPIAILVLLTSKLLRMSGF
jgi:hypothetical protein